MFDINILKNGIPGTFKVYSNGKEVSDISVGYRSIEGFVSGSLGRWNNEGGFLGFKNCFIENENMCDYDLHIAFSPAPMPPVIKANDIQFGGDHYKSKGIEPWDYAVANKLGFLEGSVVKYVTRYKDKNGIEDLKKARHYLDKLIETLE
jgi:hypothetical protein